MKKVTIDSEVREGVLIRNRSLLSTAFKSFEGCRISVTVQKERDKRSSQQNRYYWGVVIKLIADGLTDQWGEVFTADETHEFLKQNFNFEEIINQDTGEVYRKTLSTTANDTYDFSQYVEKCRDFAASYLGVNIPDPDEQMTLL